MEDTMGPKILIVMMTLAVTACATHKVAQTSLDEVTEATRIPDSPKPVELIEVPQLLALPGQLKSIPPSLTDAPEMADPIKRVSQANESARVQPSGANYINAT